MKYVALLRGINVGNSVKVDMKELKGLFEELGCAEVSTYINSGNVFFESARERAGIREAIENKLAEKTGSEIRVLIKSKAEIEEIANSIPADWKNDADQRTDVAYLFESIDSGKTLEELPIRKEHARILYVPGALIWNMRREDLNKSRLNKLISHKMYREMTVRNVNTARCLASR